MIYLCSLYSNGLGSCEFPQQILEDRVDYTMKRVFHLISSGKYIYSPILHCHELSKRYPLPKGYEYWKSIDRNAINHCSEVYVLKMSDKFGNWKDSTGITDEVRYALSIGKRVTYLECEDYEYTP